MFVLGSVYLDPEKQLLTVGDRSITLQRKPYQVFLWLIENRHRMVNREELLDRFWEGKQVYDQSLSKAVGSIRKALGEPAGSEWIETRWGLGYRYVGPFSEVPADATHPQRLQGISAGAGTDVSEAGQELAGVPPGRSRPEMPAEMRPEMRLGMRERAMLAPEFISGLIRHHGRAVLLGLMVAFAAAAVAFAAYSRRTRVIAQSAGAAPAAIRSVAVLPFTAESSNEEDQYLGLELADAVAGRLGSVSQLRVRSSATVRSIVGASSDRATAGQKLEVQALVKGDIHRIGEKVLIHVRLVNSATGKDLWVGSLASDNTNIFATEDSIAQQVASLLLPQFDMREFRPATGPDTTHPEAYSTYMKAKFFSTTRTRASLARATELLRQAIAVDPNYARAYAALADCYQLEGFYQFVAPSEAYPRSKAAALKALSLDNSLAEAHVALLSALTDYDWDWEGAEREFKATVALDPNYAVAYQYYGYALLGMGRAQEGVAAMKHAAELDPVSPSVQTSLAWGYYLVQQNEMAVAQCNRVLELYPDFVPAHQLLGIVYGRLNADQRSMAELNHAELLEPDSTITPTLLDYELARVGKRAEAERALSQELRKLHSSSAPDYYVAAAWAEIGNKRKAEFSLEHAYQVHSNWVIYLQYDPRFDNLRPEPQFQALLHRIAFASNPGRSARL